MTPTEAEVDTELANVQREERTPGGRAWRRICRFTVRSLRIVGALVFLGLALWATGVAVELLGRPFAAQSLLGLLGGIVLAWIAWQLYVVTWVCAFGEGPDDEDELRRQVNEARTRLGMAKAREDAAEQERLRDQEQSEWIYSAGRSLARFILRR